MEAIKNAIGLGSTPTTTSEQQGREPVNGVTGSGVAGEPYDQGNSEGMHCTALMLTLDIGMLLLSLNKR